MNQNKFIVNLINQKEKMQKLYQDRYWIIDPIFKGLLTLLLLMLMRQLFAYESIVNYIWVILGISVVQAVLPINFLFYIVSAFVGLNLWNVSLDICAIYVVCLLICIIAYFRIDDRYIYLVVIVPAFFLCKLGFVVPGLFAVALGMEAFFPVIAGALLYYFGMAVKDSVAVLGTENIRMGTISQRVASQMLHDQKMILILAVMAMTIIITSLLSRLFNERAVTIAIFLGNISMGCMLLIGRIYANVDLPMAMIFAEIILAILLCFILDFFRGMGDVSRIEKTVFEDEEYIYYVKAVPKLKITREDPNIKIMNEEILPEEEYFEEELPFEEEAEEEIIEDETTDEEGIDEEATEEEIIEDEIIDEEAIEEEIIDGEPTDEEAMADENEEESPVEFLEEEEISEEELAQAESEFINPPMN